MKPTEITRALDLALKANEEGYNVTPLFTGDSGIGKSEIIQQWVKKQRETDPNFGFVDLRLAYLESSDIVGFPQIIKDESSKTRTTFALPDFWPTNGRGIFLFEEPNRSTSGVMNVLMQVLTDRKVHDYHLPPGWIMAGAINPDSAEFDVNRMDVALRNRFVEYEVEYDHNTFVDFIEKTNYHETIINFVKSGAWIFKDSKSIGANGKYVSPRSWSKMNAVLKSGLDKNRELHFITSSSILGPDIGKEFYKFCFDDAPVTAQDLRDHKRDAIKRLKQQSDLNNYKGDMIAVTVESIIKNYVVKSNSKKGEETSGFIDENLMAEVAAIIPSDQALNLIKGCALKAHAGDVAGFFKELTTRHPELIGVVKSNIKLAQAVSKK